jgi:hypothetical protein
MTYMQGQPYVAWTERSAAGNPQLYVQTYNGSGWALVGTGPLNKDATNGWVFHPRLASDGTNLYLSWEEQVLGQPSQLYVSQWNSATWQALGSSLNIDPLQGTAQHSSMTIFNHNPLLLWNEGQPGQLQQTFAKQWNGSDWTLIPNLRQ